MSFSSKAKAVHAKKSESHISSRLELSVMSAAGVAPMTLHLVYD